MQVKNCYTSELAQLIPFPNKDVKRPSKEVLEFSSFNTTAASLLTVLPYYQFRNLLFICPKNLNFTNRAQQNLWRQPCSDRCSPGADLEPYALSLWALVRDPLSSHRAQFRKTAHVFDKYIADIQNCDSV